MPKLWTETIESHRREVHAAILETTASLVAERGILGVTMSQIAEQTGIGRATLYKYFPDVEAILDAWHRHHIDEHLALLAEARDGANGPGERLLAVLETYAAIQYRRRVHHASELATHLHGGDDVRMAERELRLLIRGVLVDAARGRCIRTDVSADELTHYCVRSLAAAADVASKAGVRRLVQIVADGLAYDA